jgi:ribosomal protein S18 acetylase RimI-like enzyme
MKSIETSTEDAADPLISIRPAGAADAGMVAQILTECFHPPVGLNALAQPWILASLRMELTRRLERPSSVHCCLIAVSQGLAVGTVEVAFRGLPRSFWLPDFSPRERLVYISNLGVSGRLRRRGVARRLLIEAEAWARRWNHPVIRLHVMADNTAALKLYRSLGYTLEDSEREFPLIGPLKLLLHKRLSWEAHTAGASGGS